MRCGQIAVRCSRDQVPGPVGGVSVGAGGNGAAGSWRIGALPSVDGAGSFSARGAFDGVRGATDLGRRRVAPGFFAARALSSAFSALTDLRSSLAWRLASLNFFLARLKVSLAACDSFLAASASRLAAAIRLTSLLLSARSWAGAGLVDLVGMRLKD